MKVNTMKNRYIQFSKAPTQSQDDDLLAWKIHFDLEDQRFIVTFSDGEQKRFKTKQDARRYINEKFFSTYF